MARTELNIRSRTPLYQQVAAILRDRIDRWELDKDGRLPSKVALRDEFAVSLRTIDTALGVLKAEGAIVPVIGKGMYAVPAEERVQPTPRRRSTDR